ncbi:hypothetical protein FQR65_LT09282 [Abscondita terminalis]|nr:hypothetical protein FQR65_LT09282 [Abscondita terminalis]
MYQIYTFLFILLCARCSHSLPDEGKWDYNLTTEHNHLIISKSLYKGSQIFIKVNCESEKDDTPTVTISWVVVQSLCWDYSEAITQGDHILTSSKSINGTNYHRSVDKPFNCNDHILLDEATLEKNEASLEKAHPVYIIPKDGVYVLIFRVDGQHWPLLPFYGIMCILYVIYGLIWLIVSFMQWRDLLRVQFWIGGVILLGMLEKATFYAEFQSINNSGVRVQGAMIFAEWVSCAKRTLARMLVIIVSLGFGIVKPRLGAALHRVIGVGVLYFLLASCESYLRITKPKNDQTKDLLVASVPLAVLDSAICWWIFNALVNTTRTLRLRRNEVKLSLYRHFTNTLIFSVVASVIFMLYAIKMHRIVTCLLVWKDLWLEEAYWHILFSAVLLVIMILWRPTNNNQRYAFVPLLETGDDEEEEQLVNDAYGVKIRINHQRPVSPKTHSIEDDIKWLEENIKSDPTLPILDSDEEVVNTRFEVSKMQ